MRAEVLRQSLQDHRRATTWWVLGVALFVGINIATWPAIEGQTEYDDLLDDMPDAMLAMFGIERGLSLTSPAGFLISQVFGFVLPLLFVVLAVSLGSRAIAAEEEQHTLDLLLSQPISRRRVALEKLAAVLLVVVAIGVSTWVVLVVTCPMVGLDAGLADLAVATGADVLLGLQCGALALAVGAALGRRAPAIAVPAVVALAGFVIETLAEVATAFERVRWLSPFHYVNGNIPMLHGLRALDVAVLVGLTVAAGVVGVVAFERRDLSS
jgi:ABC-2 type transport system permease protein